MQIPVLARRGQAKPYGSIPRINWAHPLTFGLTTYAYDVDGVCIDLTTGGCGIFTTATKVGRKSTRYGNGYTYTTSSGAIQMPQPTKFSAILASTTSVAPWTIASGFFVTSVPQAAGTFSLADNGANNIMGAALASSTSVDYVTSNGQNDMDGVTVPNYLNKFSTIATVAVTANSAIGYFNGLNVASNAVSNACSTGGISVPVINTLQLGGLSFNGITGTVYFGGIWDRALTQQELLQLHNDPYCFLIYPEDEMLALLFGQAASPAFNIEQDFVARSFRASPISSLMLFRQNPASDASTLGPQIEAPQSVIARFRPQPLARPVESWATDPNFLLPQVEQQPHFLGRFTPTPINVLEDLRQSDTPMPFALAQPETNTNFIGRFSQLPLNLMALLRQNPPIDQSTPLPQIEAQPHFLARFKNSVVSLLPGLRQTDPHEPAPVAGNPAFVQHVGGGTNPPSAGNTGNAFKFSLPNPIGANNCLILGVTYDNGQTPTITDNNGNSWSTAAVHANAGSGNLDSSIFVLPNANAGATVITVTFGSAVASFNYCISEFCNVALSAVVSGTHATAFAAGTSLAAGSFTPTVNDAFGGNLVWAYFAKAEGSGNATHTVTAITPGSSFTLLDGDIGWKNPDGGHASEYFVQATSAAINPGLTVTSDTDHYNSLAVSLFAQQAGTPAPVGIRIAKILHFTTGHFPTSGNYTLLCPSIGNLRVIMSDDPNLHTLTVTDSDGNTYNNTGANGGIYFAANTSANSNVIITIAGGGGDARLSWRYCDVIGADPSPFDVFAVSGESCNSVTTVTSPPSITPTNHNGVVIANVGLGQGPGKAVTSPSGATYDLCTYTGETDFDDIENADLMAHFYNSGIGTIAWTWTITSVASNSTSGGAIAFKAPIAFGGEPSFLGRTRAQVTFTLLALLRSNPALDIPIPNAIDNPPNFIARMVTQTYQLLTVQRQNPASDATFVPTQPDTNVNFIARFVQQVPTVLGLLRSNQASERFQPETNTNFVGRFVQQVVRLLPQLRQNEPTDATFLPTQPETNTNFIGQLAKQIINVLPQLRQNVVSSDITIVPAAEAPQSFIARFTSQVIRVLPALRQNEPQDSSALPTQPETNVNFIGRFTAQIIRVIPGLRHNEPSAPFVGTAPETNTNFIGRFIAQVPTLLASLRSNPASDATFLPTQPETNISFIGRMTALLPSLMPALRQNPADDLFVPPQPETNTNFIGRMRTLLPSLMPGLRQNVPNDVIPPQPETNTNFIGRFAQQTMRLLPGLRQNEPSGDINILITFRDFIGRFVQPAIRFIPGLRQNEAQDLPQAQVETRESNPHFVGRMQLTAINVLALLRQNRPDGFFRFITTYARFILGKSTIAEITGVATAANITGSIMTTTHDPLNFICGDDWALTGPLQDANGNALSLGGASITWKLDATDPNTGIVTNQITLSLGNGIAITDLPSATIFVDVTAAQTAAIPPGNYTDWLRVTLAAGEVFTEWTGVVRAAPNPT